MSESQIRQPIVSDRYRIERELGRGGTATVYLARDVQHDRPVAIKVLYPELAASLGPERFRREIAIASGLTHPHILPVHDSGGTDSSLYYVMPFVAGESLRDRLKREIQLPVVEALRIARQVAEALGYAHARGLVHRDVKPGNILLEGDHAVVADFGVARAIETASSERLTETGFAVGTAAYMSPEQAAGAGRVDGRSDIYSLGCVLFEMLAGEPPFTGSTSQAMVAKHMQAAVPDLRVVRPSVPRGVQRVIEKALAKVPADRFATAAEFAEALDAASSEVGRALRPARVMAAGVAAVTVIAGAVWYANRGVTAGDPAEAGLGAERPRIAVLYFDDLSPDSSLRRVADGITEELIYELSGVNAFRVISRNGVRAYRGRRVPLDSMVADLRVNTVVDGSVQRWGAGLRVRAQVIDAETDTYLDSLALERRVADPVTFERSMAQELAAGIRRQMGREVRLRSAPLGSSNPLASELARKAQREREDGRAIAESPYPEDVGTALQVLRRADSLLALAQSADSSWSRTWIDRGWVAAERAQLLIGADRVTALRDGLSAAEEAVRRAPNSADALELRGTLRLRLIVELEAAPDEPDRMQKAEADLRAALDRDSTLSKAWTTLGHVLWTKGSTAEAALASRRALREDVYLAEAFSIYYDLFFADLMLGNFTLAAEWCRRGRLAFPNRWRFVQCELTLMRHDSSIKPDPDSAWRLVRTLEELDPPARARSEGRAYHTIYRRVVAGTISALAGRHDLARAELARARRATQGDSTLSIDLGYDEAYLRLVLGERDRAAQLLQDYMEARPLARDYLARDPLFRNLRTGD